MSFLRLHLPAFLPALSFSIKSPFLPPLTSLSRPSHPSLTSFRPLVHLHTPTMTSALPTPPHPSSFAGAHPVLAQAMLRITNPSASCAFYSALGMKLVTRLDFEDLTFSLFFFAYTSDIPPDLSMPQSQRAKWLWSRTYPTVELTWNWPKGTYEESVAAAEGGDLGDEVYVSGNEEPRGFGYLGIGVKELGGVVEGVMEKGLDVKVLEQGDGYVVLTDPEGYHVRVEEEGMAGGENGGNDSVFKGVMMRVKDPREAIKFFGRLGFALVAREEGNGVTEYFMGYVSEVEGGYKGRKECLLRLVHEWGSESQEGEVFVNGNVKPNRGFGHVGIIVNDIYQTVEAMEKEGYKVVRKPGPFKDVGELAFVAEPSTGYWVEIIKGTSTSNGVNA